MRPPVFAQALLAAAAPANDYEIIAGDLHEEYVRIAFRSGAKAADRWYWAQTLLSIPSLLSYTRSDRSPLSKVGVALIAIAVLVLMLVVITVIETVFQYQHIPHDVWLLADYADAAIFGAVLAWLVRVDGLRVTFFASVFLVLCFVIPAVAGNPSSQAPLSSWIVLVGVVPVMCIGAAVSQIVRRRADGSN